MTTRLSISNFAGTVRTLVAVGTAKLASMLVTTRAAGPLSTEVVEVDAAVGSTRGVSAVGLVAGLAAGMAVVSGDCSLGE